MEDKVLTFDIPGIMKCQKNRYPMLFIDKITECVPLKFAKGYKFFSYNEWYFQGCAKNKPKVWNTIQIEAMAQVFLMTFLTTDENLGKVAVSNRYNNVQFFKALRPGEKIEFEAHLNSFKHGVARGKIHGYVEGDCACSMNATIVVPEIFGKFQRRLPESSPQDIDITKVKDYKIIFGVNAIMEFLPYKYPWLFLDGITEINPGKTVKAIKNFTYNEEYFPVHFPNDPSVPGYIQIECCVQAFLLTFLSLEMYKRNEVFENLLDNVIVKRKIIPGEMLYIKANLKNINSGVAKGYVESYVSGEKAVSFDITAVVLNEED